VVPDLKSQGYDSIFYTMTETCEGCGQQIDSDWLESGRCIGCRREYKALQQYQITELTMRRQVHARTCVTSSPDAPRDGGGRFQGMAYRKVRSRFSRRRGVNK
jgi:hypothetical protein